MTRKMLLVRTSDNRKIFTKTKNLKELRDYVKVFNATVSTVYSDTTALSLNQVAVMICDPTYDNKDEFKEGSQLLPKIAVSKDRNNLITNAGIIRRKIRQRLLDGQTVSLKDLKQEFHHLDLTVSCLSNHFSTVRKELESDGKLFERVGQGEYCIKM